MAEPHDRFHSIEPKIWGPSAWKFLDAVVDSYPERLSSEEWDELDYPWIERLYNFWLNLFIPCAVCMRHYTTFLQEYPLESSITDYHRYREWYRNLKTSISRMSDVPVIRVQPLHTDADNTPSVVDNHHHHHNHHHHPKKQFLPPVFIKSRKRPVVSTTTRVCPCSTSSYSMTALVQAGAANMALSKRR